MPPACEGRTLESAHDAWTVVRGLRFARRWALLLGGNLAAEVLFACSLGVLSTALLAGLLPAPGGIGVAEGIPNRGGRGRRPAPVDGLRRPGPLPDRHLLPPAGLVLAAFRWLQANDCL
jgi:hypothetical protein